MTAAAWAAAAVVVVAGALVAARRQLLVVTVAGPSMEPTLPSGSRLLVLRTRRLRTGRIVVLHPVAGQRDLGGDLIVKRVAALAGDPVPDSVLAVVGGHAGDLVPAGRVVVIGDHPWASADSRHWGFAAVTDVVGVMAGRLA
ncbi:S26 family signal peptidase [Dactylosporangium sp. CS-033363]|uniref:S26 family signal peptidase n=1 Tax=Dactylosporangium sp. CS-033363 TaxID=3239935 RepID=UPI003D8F86C3